MSDFSPWLVCPDCGFDDFEEEDLPDGDGRVECPECGEKTDRQLNYGTIPTSEELAEVTGADPEHFERSEPNPVANDEPEVTENGISLEHEEAFYQAGGQPFYCPKCGNKCDMDCDGYGIKDIAYCDVCYILYERTRDSLVDDVSDGMVTEKTAEDRDVYEEYDCPHCGDSHPYTRPDGQYTEPTHSLHSYEHITLSCLCGNSLNGEFDVGETVNCPSCPRKYTLRQDYNEEQFEASDEP